MIVTYSRHDLAVLDVVILHKMVQSAVLAQIEECLNLCSCIPSVAFKMAR